MKKEHLINPPPAVGSEGGRRPTESPTAGGGAPKRWGYRQKREVVLRMLRGEPVDSLSRELGVEIYRLEKWRDDAIVGMDTGLKTREQTPVQAELDSAMKRIGELSMENELLWKRIRSKFPLPKRRSLK